MSLRWVDVSSVDSILTMSHWSPERNQKHKPQRSPSSPRAAPLAFLRVANAELDFGGGKQVVLIGPDSRSGISVLEMVLNLIRAMEDQNLAGEVFGRGSGWADVLKTVSPVPSMAMPPNLQVVHRKRWRWVEGDAACTAAV